MLFVDRSPRTRRAFTLIELLTVVVIIGILAGLVTAAAIRVRSSVRKASHALELKELEMALHAYKERFGEFPPDCDGANAETLFRRHVRKAWPRCTGASIDIGWTNYGAGLNARTALAFWLGGVLDANGNRIGFSSNPLDPFEIVTTSRVGPFYDFDHERLIGGCYYPTVETAQEQPVNTDKAIRYYRAENGSYAGKTSLIPFKDSRVGTAPNYDWINPRSFQILSPGLEGRAFVEPAANPIFPAGPYTEAQLEMMSNFTGGTMEDAMP